MASRKPTGPGAAAAATVRAPEQKKGDAPKLIKRPMATVSQPTSRRVLGDVGNLINGRAALANRKKPVVVAAQNCGKAVPQAAAKSRRVLNDVSNLINGRPALVNRQKAVTVAADRRGKAIKLKESNKLKREVIVTSSDSEKEKKASGGQRVSRRAPIQTLTSILTKCSRASDGVISSPNKMQLYDIDAPDAFNELAVVEYVDDIYSFYKRTESTCLPLSNYMSLQTEINERMRAILVDWIIEVQHRLMLMPESLYLTVYIIDQYLSNENVPKKELQLVGVSAMLIACKYEEIWAPLVKDLLCISDNAFSREQVLSTEKAILNQLQWNLTVPTMYMFLARYLKAAMGSKELEHMAFFYAELALVQYSMLVYSPSVTAAASVYAARCTLDVHPLWSDILEHHTGLAESELQKYSNPKLGAVSLYSPSKKLMSATLG
ncbi:hypothetical protein EJB05_32427 [Eragrostis curvula]|uniref:Cyclin N-terminal domain-containing protein n=1 Tax=Eragrostis curvula TaxID=38414 RepID=A0A5J9UHS8_9POAL|nr:hypothetical protein EJB05_32427 [Eragrostis curvula]